MIPQPSALRAALLEAIDQDNLESLKRFVEDVRRIQDDVVYTNIQKESIEYAREKGRTKMLSFLVEQKPFHFNSHTGFMEVMTLVDGIEDEDWDLEFALARFNLMLTRGWNVNDKFEKLPVITNSVLRIVLPYPPLTEFLLCHTYNPSETFSDNSTPLSIAAFRAWHAQASLLLQHGAPTSSSLPLLAAAKVGDLKMMALLLDHGIPIDGLAELPLGPGEGKRAKARLETALHVAAREAPDAVGYLMGRGTDPGLEDWDGKLAWEGIPGGREELRNTMRAILSSENLSE